MMSVRVALCFVIAFAAGCGGGMQWKGKVFGDYELHDGGAAVLEKGRDFAMLDGGPEHHLTFGSEIPLAGCDIRFGDGFHEYGRTREMKYHLIDPESVKCQARVKRPGIPIDVRIAGGDATMTDEGVFSFVIVYVSEGFEEHRSVVFKGKRTWF